MTPTTPLPTVEQMMSVAKDPKTSSNDLDKLSLNAIWHSREDSHKIFSAIAQNPNSSPNLLNIFLRNEGNAFVADILQNPVLLDYRYRQVAQNAIDRSSSLPKEGNPINILAQNVAKRLSGNISPENAKRLKIHILPYCIDSNALSNDTLSKLTDCLISNNDGNAFYNDYLLSQIIRHPNVSLSILNTMAQNHPSGPIIQKILTNPIFTNPVDELLDENIKEDIHRGKQDPVLTHGKDSKDSINTESHSPEPAFKTDLDDVLKSSEQYSEKEDNVNDTLSKLYDDLSI